MKKKNLREVEVFKNVTVDLDRLCKRYVTLLKTGFDLNPESITMLLDTTECLRALTRLYSQNKYSSPSGTFNINEEAGKVSADTCAFVELVLSMKLHDSMMSNCDDLDIEESPNFKERLDVIAGKLIIGLNAIQHTLIYDIVRINNNVDIIDDFNKSIKISKSEYDMVYKFRFCKPHRNSDIKERTCEKCTKEES